MNSRITAILRGLLSVTGYSQRLSAEQNDSITNEIVSDSITMAMPSDSITIHEFTDTDSIARQQGRHKILLSLLLKQTQPNRFYQDAKCCVCSEYADSIKELCESGRNACQPTFLTLCSKNRCRHFKSIYPRPKNAHSNQSLFRWTINGYKTRFQAEKAEILAQNYINQSNYPKHHLQYQTIYREDT